MRALYAIADELAGLLTETDSGELPEGVENQLDALALDLEDKVEGCCCAIRNLEAEETALKEEIQRLSRRAQTAANQAKRLKAYLKDNLEKVGIAKLDAGLFRVRIQRNSVPSIEYAGDPRSLPPTYQRINVILDTEAVKESVNRGDELPPGVTVTTKSHLRIS